jgi:hypothetical protein
MFFVGHDGRGALIPYERQATLFVVQEDAGDTFTRDEGVAVLAEEVQDAEPDRQRTQPSVGSRAVRFPAVPQGSYATRGTSATGPLPS